MSVGEPGIVVVTHNSAGFLAACLESALEHSRDVVVVDNLSADGTCAVASRYPVQLIANQENRGFAAAVNQGVRALATEFILLLNPDARLLSPLATMVDRARQPGVGAVGGRLLNEDGTDQTGFSIRRFPTPWLLIFECLGINRVWAGNPLNRRYRALDADLSASQQAEQPAGAFLLFPRAVWQALHGFDERFHPLWFEDVDFLRRASNAGYEIWYEASARAAHAGAHSLKTLQPSHRQQFWYGNLLRYAARHFRPDLMVRLVAASVLVGLGIRKLVAWASTGGGQPGGAAGPAWTYLVRGRAAFPLDAIQDK
jgi:N-acetylglucosaminyl-diphospho-decaprenol L-rhamnosyltransferase